MHYKSLVDKKPTGLSQSKYHSSKCQVPLYVVLQIFRRTSSVAALCYLLPIGVLVSDVYILICSVYTGALHNVVYIRVAK